MPSGAEGMNLWAKMTADHDTADVAGSQFTPLCSHDNRKKADMCK